MKRETRGNPAPSTTALRDTARERILAAAFATLCEGGFAALSTREIAARAQMSKRELYAEFGNKQGIFAALVESRARRMREPLASASVENADAFAQTLFRAGLAFLTQLYDPAVVAVFRLAIAAATDSPEVPRTLEDRARAPNRDALRELMLQARNARLVSGEPAALTGRFLALLTGDIHIPLLLGVIEQPKQRELELCVREAVAAFLQLHAPTRRTTRRRRARRAA
ncbi:MAG TPA: TetR/AcrR family transcriptional regulator [Kofleriaceae bacterium]|jgi:AcrR family transcriptional regulator|nr:TetR/AcrR family transcriptional regulator [Kofleriaceae bacterium]